MTSQLLPRVWWHINLQPVVLACCVKLNNLNLNTLVNSEKNKLETERLSSVCTITCEVLKKNTQKCVYPRTDIRMHPYTDRTIIWSTQWLEGSAPHCYSCSSAGQVTLIPPSPRPSPRERKPTANQHTVALSTRPEQRRQLAAHPRYFEAMSILNLVATHLL